MNNLIIIFSIVLCCSSASAQAVFDGYQSFYISLPNSLFKHESKIIFRGVRNDEIIWNGYRLRMLNATVFPGTVATVGDLGPAPIIYEGQKWACLEGQSRTMSGTSVRHFSVYVIDARTPQKVTLFKLPTLFNSCLNVQIDLMGRFRFNQAIYQYSAHSDFPTGLMFSEYVIQDRNFKSTGKTMFIEFVEPDNVWKFKIKPTH